MLSCVDAILWQVHCITMTWVLGQIPRYMHMFSKNSFYGFYFVFLLLYLFRIIMVIFHHSNLPDPLINISENFSILSLHLQRQIYKDNSATDNSHPYYSFPSFLIIVLELFRWNIFSLTPRLAISIPSTNTQTCFYHISTKYLTGRKNWRIFTCFYHFQGCL